MKDNKHIQSFNEHQENLNISDVRQRLIDRIDELKRDKRELFGDEDFVYIGGRTVRGGVINENTSKFYLYVYDKLVKELQDILNVV
jgi:hypothetical protein